MNGRDCGICFLSVRELAQRLQARSLGVIELVEAFLERIERKNGSTRSYIAVTADAARGAAGACQDRFTKGGRLPPLFGIPFGAKDLIDVAGIPTTAGSRVLQDYVPQSDAEVVRRLRRAGGIILGKTNLHEFAFGTTGENAVYGTPGNAYNPARLACGSSSGSASAVAHGLAAFALGTDTGGSARVPAVLNGLVGLKPTFGLVPLEGVIPFSWSLDHMGLITRTVEDCRLLLSACAGPGLTAASRTGAALRVGIPETCEKQAADEEIFASFEDAVEALSRSGASITRVALPDTAHARTVSLAIQMPEALSFHSRWLEARKHLYGADFRAGLALGQFILAEHYVRAKRLVTQYRAGMTEVFNDVDVLLTPATPIPAPPLGTVKVKLNGVEEALGDALTRFTSFFNMTGNPAVALPTRMHSLGLPIGVQLVGRNFEDLLILEAAALLEAHFGRLPLPVMA